MTKGLAPGAALSVDGTALRLWTDWAPLPTTERVFPFGPTLRAQGVQVVFGGTIGGAMIPEPESRGKIVVLLPPRGADGRAAYRFWTVQNSNPYPAAAAVAVASLDISPPSILEYIQEEQSELSYATPAGEPVAAGMLVSAAAAERLLGASPSGLRPGAAGRTVAGAFSFAARPMEAPARNVVAVLRGSDPRLRDEYVVISAHNDHVGTTPGALDHDSVRAYNRVMRPQGANDPPGEPTAAQNARIRALADSMRRAHGGPRRDSIFNGADDDGSGTVALLEIAEAMAAAPRPRRSILFVSHTAEESGLYGSQHFTDHPTVPRESIVAALNMDMVGRGRAEDIRGGGPRYIQLIGSRRLSTQLGAAIDSLNARRPERMEIDYSFDAPRHPLNRYCRSDHFMYARHGIPITYFSRGYHVDYHQVGDEPQYIDYEGLARVAGFVRDIAFAVADRPARLVVDGPKQDPNAPCRQ
ncbi:MAG: M28 family peptidase [Gemmatimonadetes bacterium]|nr:M28 family peptidase [Gemmatimonadota bacterium]